MIRILIFFASLILSSSLALAHPGALDDLGCHRDRKAQRYLCHSGILKGMSFADKEEALKYLDDATKPALPETALPETAVPEPALPDPVGPELPAPPAPDLVHVISWNIKHLGRKKLDLDSVASLLVEGDVITFQEVGTNATGQKALKDIRDRLGALTAEKICWAVSETPTGATERYAYLWRETQIAFVNVRGEALTSCTEAAITVRLGVKNASQIVREPAVATFQDKSSGKRFVLASIHLVPKEKNPEAEVHPLFDTFKDIEGAVIVAGDYNLDSTNYAFSTARDLHFMPAMKGVKTSLKNSARQLSKAYDNFWYKGISLQSQAVVNLFEKFPLLGVPEIYNNISDHCPISAVFEL